MFSERCDRWAVSCLEEERVPQNWSVIKFVLKLTISLNSNIYANNATERYIYHGYTCLTFT